MPGMIPTVDTVMLRAPRPKSPWMRSMADHRLSKLARGSPMPMNTMLVSRRGRAARTATATCSRISPGVRWRRKPDCPVAQKLHAMAHPAWLDTHTVDRSG